MTLTQTKICELISNEGLSDKDLAERLQRGVGTIRTHIRKIFIELKVKSRTELVIKYKKTTKRVLDMNYQELIDNYISSKQGTIDADIIADERMNIDDNDTESLKKLYDYMKNQHFI